MKNVNNNNLPHAEKEEMLKQLALQEKREIEHQEYLRKQAMREQREHDHENESLRLNDLRSENETQPHPHSMRRNNQSTVQQTAGDLR